MAGGTPLGQMYIELGLDVSQFNPTLNGAKNAVRYFQNNVRSLDNVMKGNGKSADLLKSKYKTLGQAISAQKKVLDQMKASFDKLEPGTAKFDKAAADIERENAKLAAMEGQLKQVEKALADVGRENTWAGKLDNWGNKALKAGEKLRAMGDAMRPVSATLATAFTLSTKKAIDFESQMNTTRSLLADTVPTVKQLDKVTAEAGESSKKWAKQYGISTSSVNEGMQELIKAGYDWNQTQSAMPAILNASKASGEDFNTVMNATSSIIAQYGLKAGDAARVTDSLTFVANKTKAGFADMGNAMEYVGPVAHSLGMSLEETSAAIGLLSNAGIQGEKAGTGLRGALSKLLKPSKSNALAMKELGFSVEEFQSGALKLPDILDRIKESTKGMTDAEKSALITKAFGVEAQTAMNILTNEGGDALRNLTKETQNAKDYTKNLADELSKSSKNGVERFKSSLEVLQINIGQKLLPLLTPLVEKVNDFINWLDKLPPGMQNAAVGFGLALAAGYPLLNFLGNASSGIGGLLKITSKLSSKFSGGLNMARAGAEAVSLAEGAGAAASSTSLLSGAVGLLGNPITWGVLLGGAVILGIGMYAQSVQDAKKRTEEWGTEVSKNQAAKLETFKSKVDEVKQSMVDFGAGAGSVDKVTSSVQKLADEIGKLADKNGKKKVDIAKSLGLSDETIAAIQKNTENIKSNVNQMSNEIGSIYRNASEQHRQLTAEEKAIVTSNMNEMINTQLSLMKFSGKERVKITQAINGELDGLNQTQLSKARETLEGWIKEENKSYEERKSNYKKLLADLKGTDAETVAARQELQQKLEELELEHNAKMEEYGKRWAAIEKKLTEDALKNSNPQAREGILKSLRRAAEELGFSYDEMVEKATNATSKLQEQSTMWAQTTKDASEAQRTANTQWNAMVWDLKEGKLKTNAVDEVRKALEAENGWDSMQFILKEANLTSNARLTIGEALVANGQWESLSPSEKALVINDKPAIKSILDSKEMLASWDSLPTEAKELLGRNENFMNSAKLAEETLTRWNQLTPEQKDIIARDLASPNAQVAQGAIDSIMGKSVDINAQDNTAEAVFSAQSTMDGLENVTRSLNGENLTQPEKDAAQATLDSLMDVSRQLLASNATGPEKEAAQRTLDSLQDVTRNLKGQNLTESEKNNAQRTLDSLKDVTRSLRASNQTHGGVNDAKNTLSTVHDKTVTITSIFRRIGQAFGFEKGTNYHPGGLSVVNDQKGPLYKELITLPNGRSFVPQGRNVLIDLPRGSKVLPAKQTKALADKGLLPHYANGVGIPNDAKFIREMEQAQQSIEVRNTTTQTVVDMEKVVSEIAILRSSLEKLLTGILEKPLEVALDGEVLAQNSYQRQARIMAREGI